MSLQEACCHGPLSTPHLFPSARLESLVYTMEAASLIITELVLKKHLP